MLTLQCLREERDRVISALAKRHVDAAATVDQILELDAQRRASQTELDQVLAESNALSRQIGGLMREGKREDADAIKAQTAGLKDKSNALKEAMESAEANMNELLVQLPNTRAISWQLARQQTTTWRSSAAANLLRRADTPSRIGTSRKSLT